MLHKTVSLADAKQTITWLVSWTLLSGTSKRESHTPWPATNDNMLTHRVYYMFTL